MSSVKQNGVILAFMILCLGVIALGLSDRWDGGIFRGYENYQQDHQAGQESYFKMAHVFVMDGIVPKMQSKTRELVHFPHLGQTHFTFPIGSFFTSKGREVFFEGEKGQYFAEKEFLYLEKEVYMKSDEYEIWADRIEQDIVPNESKAIGNVKSQSFYETQGDFLQIESEWAKFWMDRDYSEYHKNVVGFIERKRSYEGRTDFKSDFLAANLKIGRSDLKGNVYIQRDQLKAWGRRGEIYLDNFNKKLKYYVLFDNVIVKEKVQSETGSTFTREAFGEKLEGIVREDKMILTGLPRVYQLLDTIKGNIITLRRNSEIVEVDDSNTRFKIQE